MSRLRTLLAISADPSQTSLRVVVLPLRECIKLLWLLLRTSWKLKFFTEDRLSESSAGLRCGRILGCPQKLSNVGAGYTTEALKGPLGKGKRCGPKDRNVHSQTNSMLGRCGRIPGCPQKSSNVGAGCTTRALKRPLARGKRCGPKDRNMQGQTNSGGCQDIPASPWLKGPMRCGPLALMKKQQPNHQAFLEVLAPLFAPLGGMGVWSATPAKNVVS